VRRASGTWRYLPLAVLVTLAIVVLPLAVVELVQGVTGIESIPLSVAVAIAFATALASVGAWLWQRSPRSRDILFGDLMLWGFARRVRAERRLGDLGKLLKADPISADGVMSIREERIQVLERLARTLESRDPYMLGHSQRVARNAQMVSERMGLDAEFVRRLRLAAALHDVGKINTPTRILNKPEALTDEEYELIKRHAGDGAAMLEPLGDPDIAAMVRHHHERLDGTGYPDGLAGEEIPLGARILFACDCYDAMIAERPYRPALGQTEAREELRRVAGTQLDPRVVEALLGVLGSGS
jgi:putative nucleotidyltransferase with HDIG domain